MNSLGSNVKIVIVVTVVTIVTVVTVVTAITVVTVRKEEKKLFLFFHQKHFFLIQFKIQKPII